MNSSRQNHQHNARTALHTLRTAFLVATLSAAMLLTACGGGGQAEPEQAKAPEITRLHKLGVNNTAAGAASDSTAVQVNVDTRALISKVSLVSTVDQSSVALAFKADGNSLTVQLPNALANAAAGTWMLVVTDDAGLASAAALLNLNQNQ
jgi:hypothetical protein